ncbi:transporter [Burkholderia thailandensis]|uniref:Lysine exporter protein n=1 Tax=Burkholderia thailandensis TaxID=57975 RepID=A0AAW9CXL4_BURTH|nr:putative lysine exporter protein [Burkholderia thailandensis H0587]AIP65019.1 transporter [Burkholderia thailandensis]AOI54569.1 transporter [Burkholderia thailandensis]AOJ54060.1 transporter [Burkholderia thailandensis]MDW9235508.1 putative lysine exporter protein [Burkholderia thailandensis]
MSRSGLAVFAVALPIAAESPGPSIAAPVARVPTNGFRDVLPFLAAMWLGEVVWLTCAAAGLAVIAHTFAVDFLALKFARIADLLFLAWKMWSCLPMRHPATSRAGSRRCACFSPASR